MNTVYANHLSGSSNGEKYMLYYRGTGIIKTLLPRSVSVIAIAVNSVSVTVAVHMGISVIYSFHATQFTHIV